MAFRATAQKLKSFAPTADRSLNPAPDFKARLKRGDFVPVGIVLGMVATASDGGSMGPGGSLGPGGREYMESWLSSLQNS